MRGVLDQELLNGTFDAITTLRPPRLARLVSDSEDLMKVIAYLHQVWGGARTPLIPIADSVIDPEYLRELASAAVDGINVDAEAPEPGVPDWLRGHAVHELPAVELVQVNDADRAVITNPVLKAGDPWRLVYACVFGRLPPKPDPSLYPSHLVGEAPSSFAPFELVNEPVVGSMDDLISRLLEGKIYPASLGDVSLAGGEQPDQSLIVRSTIPNPPRGTSRRGTQCRRRAR